MSRGTGGGIQRQVGLAVAVEVTGDRRSDRRRDRQRADDGANRVIRVGGGGDDRVRADGAGGGGGGREHNRGRQGGGAVAVDQADEGGRQRRRRGADVPGLVVAFIEAMLRDLVGRFVVVWDGGPMHQGEPIRALEEQFADRLSLERLPPWAPMLNPVEPLWSWLKWERLSNFAAHDVSELDGRGRRHPGRRLS
jgi:hypothetical protein